jgi:hypothetical protein
MRATGSPAKAMRAEEAAAVELELSGAAQRPGGAAAEEISNGV